MSRMHLSDEELASEWPYLTRWQVQEFSDAFRLFDQDGGGSIDSDELRQVMKTLGARPTKKELKRMVAEIDVDGNGEIDFAEFLAMMLRKTQEGDTKRDMVDVFAVFDTDGGGTVDAAELREGFKNFGEKITDDDVEDALLLADQTEDGEIDYEEFVQIVLQQEDEFKRDLAKRVADLEALVGPNAVEKMTPQKAPKAQANTKQSGFKAGALAVQATGRLGGAMGDGGSGGRSPRPEQMQPGVISSPGGSFRQKKAQPRESETGATSPSQVKPRTGDSKGKGRPQK